MAFRIDNIIDPGTKVKLFIAGVASLVGGAILTGFGRFVGIDATTKIFNMPWTVGNLAGILLLVVFVWVLMKKL